MTPSERIEMIHSRIYRGIGDLSLSIDVSWLCNFTGDLLKERGVLTVNLARLSSDIVGAEEKIAALEKERDEPLDGLACDVDGYTIQCRKCGAEYIGYKNNTTEACSDSRDLTMNENEARQKLQEQTEHILALRAFVSRVSRAKDWEISTSLKDSAVRLLNTVQFSGSTYELMRTMLEEHDAEQLTRVCPGCHAVAPERCAPGCIDAEIAQEREDADQERSDREADEDDERNDRGDD